MIWPESGRARALFALGTLGLLAFYALIARTRWVSYSDFDQVYMAGLAWLRGESPYNGHLLPRFAVADGPTNEMLHTYYYAPLCGMLFAPVAFLPFQTAIFVWKFGVFTLLLGGAWRFMRLACAEVPLAVRWCALGVTALAASLRWNLVMFQPTALTVALLVWFACCVLEDRFRWALFLGVLISVKVTYLLPVLGLFLYRRRLKELVLLGVCVAALNGLSLLRTGPARTLETYRDAMATFEEPGKMTRPDALDFLVPFLTAHPESPLVAAAPKDRSPGHWAGEQVHFPFILSAWNLGYDWSKRIGAVLGLLTLGVVVGLGWRARQPSLAASRAFQGVLFAALMATSIVVVYHQRYDAIALLPCAFVALGALYRDYRDPVAWTLFGSTLVLSYLLPARLLDWWHLHLAVQHGWLIAVPICGYLAVTACVSSLALGFRYAERER